MPDLTLPQRLYLLCYTVDKDKFELTNLQGRGQLLRAGAMAELTLDGLLRTEGKKVVRSVAGPPGDSFLAEVWHDMPTDKPKGWLNLVHNKAHTAEKPVRAQLAAAGALSVSPKKVLGVLPAEQVTLGDPQQVSALQETVRGAVLGGADPAEVRMDEVVMAVFAAATEVTSVFSRKELREHKQTLKGLAEHFDQAVPGLRSALRDSYLSSRAVGGGWSA